MRMVDGQLFLLNEWLEGIDRVAREVWQTQGEAITPEFVRDILVPEAIMLIDVRKSTVSSNVTRAASQFSEDPYPAQHHLVIEIGHLKAKVSEKYEIEVLTLEHKQARKPRPRVPEPIRPVSTSGSLSLNSTSKPSEVPHDPPSYFPSDLWPQTNVVLLEARRKFPQRTQTLELCKYVVAQMTRIFVEAVKTNKIKAGEVQRENGGGIEDLLHSLLVHNDDGIKGGFSSLSNQAYELGKRVRESDEWAGLAEAIAEAERGEESQDMKNNKRPTNQRILVLISHSSKDKALAEALIELLRAALGLRAEQIRCSSVDGYRLPAGVNTDDQLRAEIRSAAVLIGLLTPSSLSSTYVLFELGARWGAGLFMIPLLAGISAEAMHGPQRALNALSCETEEQLIQLVEDVARELNLKPQSATSFLKQARAIKSMSESLATFRQTQPSGKTGASDEMEPFGPHNYFYRDGRTIGPYCPKCWQKDGKKVLLPAATDYAGGQGRVCTVCREFYIEEPRKGPLTIKPHGY